VADNYWRLHTSKEQEAVWDRTSPVSSVDARILQQNIQVLERVSMRLPEVNANIAFLEGEIERLNREIVSTTDTGEIVSLANQRNLNSRRLEMAKTEQSVLKGQERGSLQVINKNRDEMAKFYEDGPYMTENKGAMYTVVGWGAILAGAYYLVYNEQSSAGVRFRSLIRKSPLSASFR